MPETLGPSVDIMTVNVTPWHQRTGCHDGLGDVWLGRERDGGEGVGLGAAFATLRGDLSSTPFLAVRSEESGGVPRENRL